MWFALACWNDSHHAATSSVDILRRVIGISRSRSVDMWCYRLPGPKSGAQGRSSHTSWRSGSSPRSSLPGFPGPEPSRSQPPALESPVPWSQPAAPRQPPRARPQVPELLPTMARIVLPQLLIAVQRGGGSHGGTGTRTDTRAGRTRSADDSQARGHVLPNRGSHASSRRSSYDTSSVRRSWLSRNRHSGCTRNFLDREASPIFWRINPRSADPGISSAVGQCAGTTTSLRARKIKQRRCRISDASSQPQGPVAGT